MKHYNIQNYIRYKSDLEVTLKRVAKKDFHEYTRDELIITFLPLVENLARKFATSQQASGVMAITDLIQEGAINLIKAVDRIDWETIRIYEECIERGFNVQNYIEAWNDIPEELMNDYNVKANDIRIIRERINEKLNK